MKVFFTCLLLMCSVISINAAELRSIQIGGSKLYYYFSKSELPRSGRLIVFMHGGVSQYMNKAKSDSIPLAGLLENNTTFLSYCSVDGFDLIIPIAYNNYNWLDLQGKTFIDTLISLHRKPEQKIILSGFSDGGTGAYKYFYTTPEKYDGVVIFNGYPQHKNFYKTVDYLKVTNKTVMFVSQDKDKVIPYEFLLREYRRQKMVNRETYFMLGKGHHRFNEYSGNDFAESFLHEYSNTPLANKGDSITIYAPVDCYMDMNSYGKVISLYKFRQSAVKKYGMSEAEYNRTDYEFKTFNKMLKTAPLHFGTATIKKDELMNNDHIEFRYEYKGTIYKILLKNYFRMKTF